MEAGAVEGFDKVDSGSAAAKQIINGFEVGDDIAVGHIVGAVRISRRFDFGVCDFGQAEFFKYPLNRAGSFGTSGNDGVFINRLQTGIDLQVALNDVLVVIVFGIPV